MRLVAWNCGMAYHRKHDAVRAEHPDIVVVSECASPEILGDRTDLRRLGQMVWVGTNPHKGLAVFARRSYTITLDPSYDPALKYLAPIRVEGPQSFRLLAVWAQNFSDGITRKNQPGPFRLGLDYYHDFLADGPVVVAGDKNNNAIWDRPGWPINHADAVEGLAVHGLHSVYHELRGEAHGEERTPTIYWRDRRLHGPRYHLDYVFAPEAWLPQSTLRVGSFRKWVGSGLSDHVPLIYELAPSGT